MLPIIDEEIYNQLMEEVLSDLSGWRKRMIHYIKDENPEVNAAIVDIAQKTNLDPKAVATGAYITYLLLEHASITSEYDSISIEE